MSRRRRIVVFGGVIAAALPGIIGGLTIAGALGMMANWDLAALDRAIGGLDVPLLLVVGGDDRAIAPETAFALADRLPNARVSLLRHLGHLAHEEAPDRVAEIIVEASEAATIESSASG